ncbi:MAG TPA: hypothetical protein VGC62_25435 [Pseudomonas sp.]|uniref:hypothetical protein n=1 Tax=Pseudomonas sp. TaxID=306 RepID=UPI002ED8A815
MSACAITFQITHQCRNCGQHHPAQRVLQSGIKKSECPLCHSTDVVELESTELDVNSEAITQSCVEYTVVFRMEDGHQSKRAFMRTLTETFADHNVEIVEIHSGNTLRAAGGQ